MMMINVCAERLGGREREESERLRVCCVHV